MTCRRSGQHISKAAIRRLTPDEPPDPIDGSTDSFVRELALKEVGKSLEDLSDSDYDLRTTDEFWFISYCLDTFHALPSQVAPLMGCKEYCTLQAHAIIKGIYARLAREAAESTSRRSPHA